MTVTWGLDLREMQWSKFKSSYMFGNRDYHMRRTKFVVYQLAMILMVCSESIGTAALSDYVKQQTRIENLHSSARVHNDDFVGVASYNIFVGVAVATVFGAAFFFDLFWPERYEPSSIRLAWKLAALFVSLAGLGDAIGFTIIVARRTSWISADSTDQALIAQEYINPPLRYRDNGRAVAALVLLWLGWLATVASTYILLSYYRYSERNGPWTKTARAIAEKEKAADSTSSSLDSHAVLPSLNDSLPLGKAQV